MKKLIALALALVCALALVGCNVSNANNSISQKTDTSEETIYTDTPVCSRINLCYHGNLATSITIEDDSICSQLMALITQADGTREGSSKGYYGVPYTLTIYFEEDEDPLVFCLWSDTQYSTSKQRDAEGYQYLFSDDLSDLYQYLEERYPDEFWYDDITSDN